MGDQSLASSRVAWLQSRAECRVQESIDIYKYPILTGLPKKLSQTAIFCFFWQAIHCLNRSKAKDRSLRQLLH